MAYSTIKRVIIDELMEKTNINYGHREIGGHLKSQGWSVHRDEGSHTIWKHPKAKHHIAVPRHKKISPGVVREILKKSVVE